MATIPAALLLQTIPGIGPHRALLICAEGLPITRFATPQPLRQLCGLAPSSSPTGMRGVRHGLLTAGANRWLRGTLVRAVVSHVRHAPDSELSRSSVASSTITNEGAVLRPLANQRFIGASSALCG